MAANFLKLVNGGQSKKNGAAAVNNPFAALQSSNNPFRSSGGFQQTSTDPFNTRDGALRLTNTSVSTNDILGNRAAQIKQQQQQLAQDEDGDDTAMTDVTKTSAKKAKKTALPVPTAVALSELQQQHSIAVDGEDVPGLLPSFELIQQQYHVPGFIQSNLTASLQDGGFGFTTPTPIQMQAIPGLMSKRDIMAFAPTGSGKTLAFALPMVNHVYNYAKQQEYLHKKQQTEYAADGQKEQQQQKKKTKEEEKQEKLQDLQKMFNLNIHGLVLCPTRELALQTHRVYNKLLRERPEYFDLPQHVGEKKELIHCNATLLTKKWKLRCIRSYKERLYGKKAGAGGDDDDEEEEEEIFKKFKNNKEIDELKDEDGDNDQNMDDDEDNTTSGGVKNIKNKHYHILITTPLLLLSLLDRCSKMMMEYLDTKYPAQYSTTNSIAEINKMIIKKKTKSADDEEEEQKQNDKKMSKKNTKSQQQATPNNKKHQQKKPALLEDNSDTEDETETDPAVAQSQAKAAAALEKLQNLPKLLQTCQMFVIDECDRLLDWGFLQQVNNILSFAQRIHDDYDYDEEMYGAAPAAAAAEDNKAEEKKSKKSNKKDAKKDTKKSTSTTTTVYTTKNKRRMILSLVSATITPAINTLSQTMLTLPIKVTVGEANVAQITIKQHLTYVMNEDGKRLGVKQIINKGASLPMIIFAQTKDRVMQLKDDLQYTFSWLGHKSSADTTTAGGAGGNSGIIDGTNVLKQHAAMQTDATTQHISRLGVLHGDLTEQERLSTITKFRIGEIWILICTDVIARGLDFAHVKCVLNYDFPSSVTTYVHRIGRTGRAGLAGKAITFVTDDDKILLPNIAQIVKKSEDIQQQQQQQQEAQQKRQDLLANALKKAKRKARQILAQRDAEENGENAFTMGALQDEAAITQLVQDDEEYDDEVVDINAMSIDDLYEMVRDEKMREEAKEKKNNKNKSKNKNDNNTTTPNTSANQFESGVADWMLSLPLATQRQQRELLFKQPIREEITYARGDRHEQKKTNMFIFHNKREQAEKLGIVSRNEGGTVLKDKFQKKNEDGQDNNNNKKRKQMSQGKDNKNNNKSNNQRHNNNDDDDIKHINKRTKR